MYMNRFYGWSATLLGLEHAPGGEWTEFQQRWDQDSRELQTALKTLCEGEPHPGFTGKRNLENLLKKVIHHCYPSLDCLKAVPFSVAMGRACQWRSFPRRFLPPKLSWALPGGWELRVTGAPSEGRRLGGKYLQVISLVSNLKGKTVTVSVSQGEGPRTWKKKGQETLLSALQENGLEDF